MAEIASSSGRSSRSMRPRSTSTDVSTIPRGWRGSGTGRRILIENRVEIAPQVIEPWRTDKRRNRCISGNEAASPERRELPHRNPVARDDEGLPAVQGAHDLSAVVTKLSLGDFPAHMGYCSTRATSENASHAGNGGIAGD